MLGPSARAESGPCRCGGRPPTNLQEPPSPNPHLCLVTALDIEANLSLSLQQNKHSSLRANKKNIKTPSSTTRQQTASLPRAAPEPRPTQGQQWPSRTVQEPEAQGPSVRRLSIPTSPPRGTPPSIPGPGQKPKGLSLPPPARPPITINTSWKTLLPSRRCPPTHKANSPGQPPWCCWKLLQVMEHPQGLPAGPELL